HFTLDKNLSDFRDHRLSADPTELAELVRRVRAVAVMLGVSGKRVMPCEAGSVAAVRRGVYAARDLAAGAVPTLADLVFLRPRAGLSPADFDRLAGKRLARPVKTGEPLSADAFV
ncbi:MAG: SAF domain-containing protein, partial [Stellaceae bacterium]